jgi:hypothetical protein
MKFTYKINLDVDVEFEAPLLGADTTSYRRSVVDKLAKQIFKEVMSIKTHSGKAEMVVDDGNTKGSIKCSKTMRADIKDKL